MDNNEVRELAKELVSDVERIEPIICYKCYGNGKIYLPVDPDDIRDHEPIICKFCKGSGRLVKNIRTRIMPYRGTYISHQVIIHVEDGIN